MAFEIKNVMDYREASISAIFQGNLKMGIGVTSQAKGLCPVDTGRLRNSITYKTSSSRGPGIPILTVKPKSNEIFVGTGVSYGPYIEFGTRKQKAQPFIQPAISIIEKIYNTAVKASITAVYKDFEEGPFGIK